MFDIHIGFIKNNVKTWTVSTSLSLVAIYSKTGGTRFEAHVLIAFRKSCKHSAFHRKCGGALLWEERVGFKRNVSRNCQIL